jgi:hypothetical protein
MRFAERVAWNSCALLLAVPVAFADLVPVRFAEGMVHGFLTLRSPEGKVLASGDLLQTNHGGRVTTRLLFHFKDGSVSDETAVYSQNGHFRLIRDHSIQRGPAFARPVEMTIEANTGAVVVRYRDDHGEEKVEREQMKLPADLANGLVPVLLKNVRRDAPPATLALVAATPKPRLVKLKISVAGTDSVSIAGVQRKATHYVLKVDIGGVTGWVASIAGKQPPDSHVWILEADVPAFLRSRTPLGVNGPLCQTDLVGPEWPER